MERCKGSHGDRERAFSTSWGKTCRVTRTATWRPRCTDERTWRTDSQAIAAEAVGLPGEQSAESIAVPIAFEGWCGQLLVEPWAGVMTTPGLLLHLIVEFALNYLSLVEDVGGQRELRHKFIHDLVHGTLADEQEALRLGQMLGIDFSPPRAVMLIDASAWLFASHERPGEIDETQLRRRVQRVISEIVAFFHLPTDAICGYVGDGEIVILKASASRDLRPWVDQGGPHMLSDSWANVRALKRAAWELLHKLHGESGLPISIGVGRYYPGIQGLSHSYHDARAALRLGLRLHGPNRVYALDDLGMAAFVGSVDEHTKIDLALHLLSPLDHDPTLIDTLRTFFAEDGHISRVAERLQIHRNTLRYRLDRVTALTGLDPRRFDQAVQLRLALLIRQLHSTGA